MPPTIRRSSGPWAPQLSQPALQRESFFKPAGPSPVDVKCKAALQQVLRPCHYAIIVPWMSTAPARAKEDMCLLGSIVNTADAHLDVPALAYKASQEPLVVNRHGRPRLAQTIPVSADRAQSDLQRNRHGFDQRDPELQRKRCAFSDFAPVPNCTSVSDFYAMGNKPIVDDEAMKVLTEQARRKLQCWQVRGPEQDRQAAAHAMRSLRTLSQACAGRVTYSEHTQIAGQFTQGLDRGQAMATNLHEFSKMQPRDHTRRFLLHRDPPPHQLSHAVSEPVMCPLIDPKEISAVSRPGGQIIHYLDKERLQMLKNRQRGKGLKIPESGTAVDWSTTYNTLMEGGLSGPL